MKTIKQERGCCQETELISGQLQAPYLETIRSFDTKGNLIATQKFMEDGETVIFQEKTSYTPEGQIAELATYTEDPDTPESKIEYLYENGKVISEKVTEYGEVIEKINTSYDNEGRPLEIKIFDMADALVSVQRFEYLENCNIKTEYDENGIPQFKSSNFLNDQGKELKIEELEKSDLELEDFDQKTVTILSYDDRDNCTSEKVFEDVSLVTEIDKTFDSFGNLTKTTTRYPEDDVVLENHNTYLNNDPKKLLTMQQFENGELVSDSRFEYNENGDLRFQEIRQKEIDEECCEWNVTIYTSTYTYHED